MMPYRIVARSAAGDQRVFYARRLRWLDGWVEAEGSFRGATRPRLKIRLPLTSVLYIEELSVGPLKHGWVAPKLTEPAEGQTSPGGTREPGPRGRAHPARLGAARRQVRRKPDAR